MKHLLHKAATLCFAIVIAVASVNLTGVAQVSAASANNGTLKVHEKGTPVGTESSDPKVCVFNFEGFGFDPGQSGFIVVTTQPGGVNSLVMPFGPADANGSADSAYVNDTGSPYTLANGGYKVTVYGKDTGNPAVPDYQDEKAKSKNFKVDCNTPAPVVVTPAAPTYDDKCGMLTDTYTIPATNGVTYSVNGTPTVAGTYGGVGTVNITTTANAGYTLATNSPSTWTFTFTNVPCIVTVTATAPTFTDVCQMTNDTYTIPSTAGVRYFVNGVERTAGTYKGNGLVTITAVAANGYTLKGTKVWIKLFTNLPCVVIADAPTKNDVCGRGDDKYTIPSTAGVRYFVNGVERASGTYSATSNTVVIVAVAKGGYILDLREDVIWTFKFTNVPCPDPCLPSLRTSLVASPLVNNPACPVADIVVTANCAFGGVSLTMTNRGNANGAVFVNGAKTTIAAGQTVSMMVPTNLYTASVKVVDEQNVTLLDQAYDCTPGQGAAGGPATPLTPFVQATAAPAPVTEFPQTGTGTWKQIYTGIILAIITYGLTYYLQGRRKVTQE